MSNICLWVALVSHHHEHTHTQDNSCRLCARAFSARMIPNTYHQPTDRRCRCCAFVGRPAAHRLSSYQLGWAVRWLTHAQIHKSQIYTHARTHRPTIWHAILRHSITHRSSFDIFAERLPICGMRMYDTNRRLKPKWHEQKWRNYGLCRILFDFLEHSNGESI